MAQTFLFHDYETWGINPSLDWPAQYAAIRTDMAFNEIEEPVNLFCQLPADHLPSVGAALVTKLTPQQVNKEGLPEAKFIQQIFFDMSKPQTCALGYNTLRFDDEVTRNALYRNFYDPYSREWKDGNSRWDLIDVVRMVAALRPDGINWPKRDDGANSFKLEHLTAVNNLDHGKAHDALSDVRATIALAKLIKEKQPKLFGWCWQHHTKQAVERFLIDQHGEPIVHVSGMFGGAKQFTAVVAPLVEHPSNKNGVIVFDLSEDPTPLLTLSVEEIQQRLFTKTEDLPEGITRLPLKVLHRNKCPAVAPIRVLRPEDQARLNIDLPLCRERNEWLKQQPQLRHKLQQVFSGQFRKEAVPERLDPDQMLYSGGFFSPKDKSEMGRVIATAPNKLASTAFHFVDKRLPVMLFFYRARNYPATLSTDEHQKWQEICQARLDGSLYPNDKNILTFEKFAKECKEIHERTLSDAEQNIIQQLEHYVSELHHKLLPEPVD